jgi:hypothetical protein
MKRIHGFKYIKVKNLRPDRIIKYLFIKLRKRFR